MVQHTQRKSRPVRRPPAHWICFADSLARWTGSSRTSALEAGCISRDFSRGHELLRREAGLVPADWSPQINVMRRDGQFVVSADLPGMSKDDIKVEVTDDMLTIQGERKNEKKGEREEYCYSECSYGSFYRAVPLPEGAEAGKATAEFNKGVLEITVPAPERPDATAKRLEVREGR